jgi:hypothetical protein
LLSKDNGLKTFSKAHVAANHCACCPTQSPELLKSGKLRNAREETISRQAHPYFSSLFLKLKSSFSAMLQGY